jgi:hypothetical protein
MPRGKKISLDVLALLPADRRQAVVEEALNSRIRGIFQKHSRATLGRLIDGLVKDEHWGVMKNVRVETVLRPSAPGAYNGGSAAANGTGKRRGRPPGKRPFTAATLDQIVDVIRKRPGLRSEQLQRELGLPRGVVKAGLAQLRKDRRVRTVGERRSTTYAAA